MLLFLFLRIQLVNYMNGFQIMKVFKSVESKQYKIQDVKTVVAISILIHSVVFAVRAQML